MELELEIWKILTLLQSREVSKGEASEMLNEIAEDYAIGFISWHLKNTFGELSKDNIT